METALTSVLLGSAPLTALVADRVHWLRQPDGVTGYPYVNLTLVSDPRGYHMGGPSALRKSRVQVDVWAETYLGAVAVAKVLDALLSGFSGAVGDVSFQGIFIVGEGDFTDKTAGGERQLFRRRVDLSLSWEKES